MKTTQEIFKAASEIDRQLDRLPEYGVDGTDNSEDREVMVEWVRQLYLSVEGGKPESIDVSNWLNGKPSELDDCFM